MSRRCLPPIKRVALTNRQAAPAHTSASFAVDYGRVDSSGELLGGALRPFTNRIWFIEAPHAAAVEAIRLWRSELETPIRFEPVSGGIDDLLGRLEPWAMPSWKQLVVETSGVWTALFSQGSDIYTFDVIGESLRCRSLMTNHETDVHRHGRIVNYGDTALRLSDGSRGDLAPRFSVRIIAASNQDGWTWDLYGESQPFEELERYRRRVIKDRFDLPTLNRYTQRAFTIGSRGAPRVALIDGCRNDATSCLITSNPNPGTRTRP